MPKFVWMLAGLTVLVTGQPQAADVGDDLSSIGPESSWARWQGRLTLGVAAPKERFDAQRQVPRLAAASLMGDYYFPWTTAESGRLGGFRATTGLMYGARAVLGTAPSRVAAGSPFSIGSQAVSQGPMPYSSDSWGDPVTLPYLGLGYTEYSLRNRLSFTADLGLVARDPASAARLGRALGGGQSLDDAIRNIRLAPLVQVGVSYSF
ncbi:MAG: hypothetical protein ABIQ60_11665 [Burkholderiaceae bacterium]